MCLIVRDLLDRNEGQDGRYLAGWLNICRNDLKKKQRGILCCTILHSICLKKYNKVTREQSKGLSPDLQIGLLNPNNMVAP